MEFIVFDIESNGLVGSSVLSISALKIKVLTDKLEIIDSYNRYYYKKAEENINYRALQVNGLTEPMIQKYRANSNYPLYFHQDIDSLQAFIGTCQHFVAHNISFDQSFLPFSLKHTYCTMQNNYAIVKSYNRYGKYKNPRLNECLQHYGIKYDEASLHSSREDTYFTFLLLEQMWKNKISSLVKFFDK